CNISNMYIKEYDFWLSRPVIMMLSDSGFCGRVVGAGVRYQALDSLIPSSFLLIFSLCLSDLSISPCLQFLLCSDKRLHNIKEMTFAFRQTIIIPALLGNYRCGSFPVLSTSKAINLQNEEMSIRLFNLILALSIEYSDHTLPFFTLTRFLNFSIIYHDSFHNKIIKQILITYVLVPRLESGRDFWARRYFNVGVKA
ncbi:hypothetical protein L9F63_011153, partial [Diploptera punctata]